MQNDFTLPDSGNIFGAISNRTAIGLIGGLSISAILFLFWLIYFNDASETHLPWIQNLSAVNASLNFVCTIFLLLGFREIKRGNYKQHMKFMLMAFVTSAFFMVSYIVYHHFAGDTKFLAEGFIRYVYFFILITHIILSVFMVPMVLSSFYLSLSGKYSTHKKLSRFTLPVWLYVSVTGVLIFLILKIFNPV